MGGSEAAHQLHEWFKRIRHLVTVSVLAGHEGAHRDAMVLNVLSRNARQIREPDVDRKGLLYSPLCFMLAAACERLGISLGPRHWEAAISNVISLSRQVAGATNESAMVGLEISSPARLLKEQVDEALLHAGVAGVPTFLDPEGRQIALGLAINWGIRFLCAYALECQGLHVEPSRQDLAWIAALLRPLMDSSAPELPA